MSGYLLSSRIQEFGADIAAIVAAAEPIGVKLMLELPMLNTRQREHAVTAAVDAGAAFVSIASRGSVGIADPATISYLRRSVPASIGVKASGGVKTVEQVRALLAAGADLIGTSAGNSHRDRRRSSQGLAVLVLIDEVRAAGCAPVSWAGAAAADSDLWLRCRLNPPSPPPGRPTEGAS